MSPRRQRIQRPHEEGFTLLEALMALAISGAAMLALAMITAQWLPNWRRSFIDVQRADLLSIGLERVVVDLSSAEFVTPNGVTKDVLFNGDELSVTFVRPAIGPNASPGLEVIRLSEVVDERGFALVRARAPFRPLAAGESLSSIQFSDPIVVIRAPFRIFFAYAGQDRVWRNAWGADSRLPVAIRIQVRDAATDQTLAATTAATLHVSLSVDCARQQSPSHCAHNKTQAVEQTL